MIPVEFEVCTAYASRGLNPWRAYFLGQQDLGNIQLLICAQDQSLICMVKYKNADLYNLFLGHNYGLELIE